VAVLLPAADLYTRLPYPKARAMIASGVRVALATDHNPGSSPGLDLALVGVLARTAMQMTLPEVLCAYTYNAACALGIEKTHGHLSLGAEADFICLRPGATLTDLFYEVGPQRSHAAVKSVWRGGKLIYS
jgi:imidazolonepropionase